VCAYSTVQLDKSRVEKEFTAKFCCTMQSISALSVARVAGLSVCFVLSTLSLQLSHLPLLMMIRLLLLVGVNRCTIHFLARCESQDTGIG